MYIIIQKYYIKKILILTFAHTIILLYQPFNFNLFINKNLNPAFLIINNNLYYSKKNIANKYFE